MITTINTLLSVFGPPLLAHPSPSLTLLGNHIVVAIPTTVLLQTQRRRAGNLPYPVARYNDQGQIPFTINLAGAQPVRVPTETAPVGKRQRCAKHPKDKQPLQSSSFGRFDQRAWLIYTSIPQVRKYPVTGAYTASSRSQTQPGSASQIQYRESG